jgi:hypothetical protein
MLILSLAGCQKLSLRSQNPDEDDIKLPETRFIKDQVTVSFTRRHDRWDDHQSYPYRRRSYPVNLPSLLVGTKETRHQQSPANRCNRPRCWSSSRGGAAGDRRRRSFVKSLPKTAKPPV